MKYIKQKSTGKIIFREEPHSDKTIDNAVVFSGIDKSDLEVAESSWTNEQWTKALHNQLSYDEQRKAEYSPIGDQLDMLWHAIDDGTLDKTSTFYTSLKATRDKYPKT